MGSEVCPLDKTRWARNNFSAKVFLTVLLLVSQADARSVSSSEQGEGWEEYIPLDTDSLDSDVPLCSQCSPGYGVASPCQTLDGALLLDTTCEKCPHGSFSREFSADNPCSPCGECPESFYERSPCQPMQDVRCLPCPNGKGTPSYGNEDFLRKCEKTNPWIPYPRSSPRVWDPSEGETESSGEEGSGEVYPTRNIFTTRKDLEEGELPEGLIPVNTKKPWPGLVEESETDNDNTTGDYNQTGVLEAQEAASGEAVHQSAFHWPILLAALAAALVFFVVGVLISQCVKRTDGTSKKQPAHDDGMVETRLMDIGDYKAPLPDVEDESQQPIYSAPPDPYQYDTTDNVVVRKNPNRKNLLRKKKKRKSFYDSQDMRYMDEDSDDEMVRHTGRPPSIFYRDRKKKKKSGHRQRASWFDRFRPKKQSASHTGSLEDVGGGVGQHLTKSGDGEAEPDYGTV